MKVYAHNDFKEQRSCLFPFIPALYGTYSHKVFNIEGEDPLFKTSFKKHRKNLAMSWKQSCAEACRKKIIAWHKHINYIIENNEEYQFEKEEDLIKALKKNKLVQDMAFSQSVLKYHKNHVSIKTQPQLYKALLELIKEQKRDLSQYKKKYRKHRPAFTSCSI